ncbi:stage II sporulation protein R [[Clostridium] leptum]|uniref:Stage II sporulation protein R n=1 Tax=Solibaculum mannosilyticum TaxID=2780922 RepID=A0A7I8D102_9FIRM|nr:stage II sporulation protein R [Solibaculum mannosilyticum]MCO7138008.1 stage II sporulation protein R [[Clostridium] leptum]BCI60457.1 stage II sporulation protein R [Solibaculum mannosilyticum]CZT56998.1 Stage II sporulation protein R (spore_II_R) [Eubacteriaceae bacterium CHKCI005]
MNFKRLLAALSMGLVIAILCSMASFSQQCQNIRESVLRLHVLANSDSQEDQALKLKVRDRILLESEHLMDHVSNRQEAKQIASQHLPELEAAAQDEIQKQGYDYPVEIRLENTYFNTRQYGSVTLPAGQYDALRVLIGSGEGHNWWCVMFPPMCLPAAEDPKQIEDVLNPGETDIVEGGEQYEVKFKIVEWFEEIQDCIQNWMQPSDQ